MGEIRAKNLEELTEMKDIERVRRYLRRRSHGIASYPSGYDSGRVLREALERRGETHRDWRSARIGFSIGYSAGFLQALKFACEVFEKVDYVRRESDEDDSPEMEYWKAWLFGVYGVL